MSVNLNDFQGADPTAVAAIQRRLDEEVQSQRPGKKRPGKMRSAISPGEASAYSGVPLDLIRQWRLRGHLPWVTNDDGGHPKYTWRQVRTLGVMALHPGQLNELVAAIQEVGGPDALFPMWPHNPNWLIFGGGPAKLIDSDQDVVGALYQRDVCTLIHLNRIAWQVSERLMAAYYEVRR